MGLGVKISPKLHHIQDNTERQNNWPSNYELDNGEDSPDLLRQFIHCFIGVSYSLDQSKRMTDIGPRHYGQIHDGKANCDNYSNREVKQVTQEQIE